MIDARARPKAYLQLMLLVALLGVVSAALTCVFLSILHGSVYLIWEQARAATGLDGRLFTLLFCTGGGLLASAFVAAIRAPWFAALFTLVLGQAETGPVIAVPVIVSALVNA